MANTETHQKPLKISAFIEYGRNNSKSTSVRIGTAFRDRQGRPFITGKIDLLPIQAFTNGTFSIIISPEKEPRNASSPDDAADSAPHNDPHFDAATNDEDFPF